MALAAFSANGTGDDTPSFYGIDLKTGLAKNTGKSRKRGTLTWLFANYHQVACSVSSVAPS